MQRCFYTSGPYDQPEGYEQLNVRMAAEETGTGQVSRLAGICDGEHQCKHGVLPTWSILTTTLTQLPVRCREPYSLHPVCPLPTQGWPHLSRHAMLFTSLS